PPSLLAAAGLVRLATRPHHRRATRPAHRRHHRLQMRAGRRPRVDHHDPPTAHDVAPRPIQRQRPRVRRPDLAEHGTRSVLHNTGTGTRPAAARRLAPSPHPGGRARRKAPSRARRSPAVLSAALPSALRPACPPPPAPPPHPPP